MNVGTSFVGQSGAVNKSVASNGSGTVAMGNIVKTSGSQISNPQVYYKMVNSDGAARSSGKDYTGKEQRTTFVNTGTKGYNYYLRIWSKTYMSESDRLNVQGSWSPDTGAPH